MGGGAADYHQRAVRPRRRDRSLLLDGVPSVGGHRYRLYRPCRGGGEFGVVMLMYLRHAIEAEPSLENPQTFSADKLDDAVSGRGTARVRPKAMTVAVIIAGLLPILWGTGAGSEVMSRIAAPMIGGMITAPLLSLFIIPAAYKLMWLPASGQARRISKGRPVGISPAGL